MKNELTGDKKAILYTKLRTYLYSVLGIALLSAIARILAFSFAYDAGIGYFKAGAFLPAISVILPALGVIWAFSATFMLPVGALPDSPDFSTGAVFFTSAYAGFVMIGDLGYQVYNRVMNGELAACFGYFANEYNGVADARTYRIRAVIMILSMLSSLIGGIWFFVRANGKRGRESVALLGFFPILRALSGIALIYFDMTVAMNNPEKTAIQIAMISVMFSFLYEIRFIISPDKARPRAYFFTSLTALLLTFTAAVSEIWGYFTGILTHGEFCVEAFICLTFFMYILARLGAYCAMFDPKPRRNPDEIPATPPADDDYLNESEAEDNGGNSSNNDGEIGDASAEANTDDTAVKTDSEMETPVASEHSGAADEKREHEPQHDA